MTAQPVQTEQSVLLDGLVGLAAEAAQAGDRLRSRAVACLRANLAPGGRVNSAAFDQAQHAAHGLAWLATYAEVLRQMSAYAERMSAEGRLGEIEALILQIGLADYCSQ